jgi:hypothetical protein
MYIEYIQRETTGSAITESRITMMKAVVEI